MSSTTSSSASAETQLMVCCARTHVSPEIAARIRNLAFSLDWNSVLATAREHGVVPLLARNLRSAAAAGAVPAEVAAQLESAVRANAIRSLAHTSELVRILEPLAAAKIRVLPYKGPVIAAQAYQDISARQFEDLDLILLQRDIAAADEAVRRLGYNPRFGWLHAPNGRAVVPGEYTYFQSERRTILELHTEATLRHFPVTAPVQEYFERAVPVDLGGKTATTFCPEDALVVYSIHGTKDFWEKLIWVVDIAELLRTFADLDWDSVWQRSERLRAHRMVHLGLALAAGLLDAQLPTEVQTRVASDFRALALASEIAKRLLVSNPDQRTAAQRFGYRRATVPGFSAGWRYAIRLTLAPAEEDWEPSEQSSSASPLRRAIRPFRLLRKYGR
jgi:hypothetical protein